MDKTIEYLQALYYTLREMKGFSYRPEDYKWVLGTRVIGELDLSVFWLREPKEEPRTLYGIPVRIDYSNPHNVQIFEDITNKIGIKREVDNDNK